LLVVEELDDFKGETTEHARERERGGERGRERESTRANVPSAVI